MLLVLTEVVLLLLGEYLLYGVVDASAAAAAGR